MARTTVIAFEGIDGSGKTVQLFHLERSLKKRGMLVDTMSFPMYGSFFGREVGNYLTGAHGVAANDVDGKSMSLWFALDRFEAFGSFSDGDADVLLINRYVLSNAVYQSIRDCDLDKPDLLDFVLELEHNHFCIPRAHAHVVLDVNIEEAGANIFRKGYREYTGNAKDLYESQANLQRRARAKYLEYSKLLNNIFVVPCMDGSKMKSETDIAILVEETLFRNGIL
ncbi:MAG: Thymidylate kinase [Firmicutes bacterium ADurb.Bin356]|nr:MAG: Thymidylate kinase [Firmicutes bacterium ADurb.Bin356]